MLKRIREIHLKMTRSEGQTGLKVMITLKMVAKSLQTQKNTPQKRNREKKKHVEFIEVNRTTERSRIWGDLRKSYK